MPFLATFIVLAVAGIVDTGYLVYKHRQKKPLVCPINHDCNVVTESRWGNFLGIRNETLGLIFYISLLSLAWRGNYSLLFLITGIGLLYSLFLVWLQVYVIKNYCFYCLISALISLLLFFNSVYLWWTA